MKSKRGREGIYLISRGLSIAYGMGRLNGKVGA